MMTVMELLQDAVKYHESLLAHAIMLGIRHGKWRPDDPETVLDWTLLDLDEVQQAKADNILGVQPVPLYSAPLGGNRHAILFANTQQEAARAFLEAFGKWPRAIYHLERGMDVATYEDDFRESKTWRELYSETRRKPGLAGIYHKGAI